MERSNPNQNIINVIFEPGRGRCDVASREACTDAAFGALPEAHRSGFSFDGWFTRPGKDGTRVSAEDTVHATGNVTLYAHYTRLRGKEKKRSSLRTQKRALIGLAGTVVLLAVLWGVVSYIVSIIPYTDAADGAKYYAKKSDGVYAVYDADGAPLPVNEQGYYLAASGTQLALDAKTGAITEYAVVDTEGLETEGAGRRIMMFAQIRQADVAKITVKNTHGSYTFYTDDKGKVQILGYEPDSGKLVSYDAQKYASLCVAAGYPLTTRKLDTAEVLKRGYAEYGLADQIRTDEMGNEYEYTPVRYTITSKTGVTHTVLVGDPIVSEAGYYVKLEGDENRAVYIMSGTNYDASLLLPIEQLITPMINYPSDANGYFDVRNFVLGKFVPGQELPEVVVAFDYIDLAERQNTMFSTTPYLPSAEYKYNAYRLDSDVLGSVLASLHEVNFVGIRKLGLSPEALAAHGLDAPAHILYYDLMVDTDGDGKTDSAVKNSMIISALTEQNTYYVASTMCDVIAEVTRASFSFLENDAIDWIDNNVIWLNLAFLRTMTVKSPRYSATLTFDNSRTDQSAGIASGELTFTINGKTPDYIVYKVSPSSGNITEEDPVYNLRQLYKGLLELTVGGSTDEGHFTLSEEQMAAYRAMDDSECQLVLTLEAEDMATKYNPEHYEQNNRQTLVYRFYRYSEGKSYMTVNGEGEFFVDAAFVEKLIADAQRLEQGILIDSTSKT